MKKHSTIIQIAAIIILCAIIYVPSLKNGFIWDDDSCVYENKFIQRMDGLKDIWFYKTVQYYPLVFTTFWIEHKLWGLNPFGFHFVNLLLHIINALLVFQVIRKIYPRGAFAVALLFAIHPIQVETVAWITELKNLLGLCFFLLATLSYLQFDRSRKFINYIRTLGLFVCAILSKTISACFAFVPIIYKWWKDGKIGWREVRISIPFFLVGLLSGISTIFLETHRVGARGYEYVLTFLERFILSGRILLFYIYKICLPFEFMFFYPRWTIDATQWWQWLFIIISIILFFSLFYLRNRIGRGAFAIFSFYIISIFPAMGFINVFPFAYSFVADHFSYLSTPALFLLLVGSVIFLFDRIKEKKPSMSDMFYRYKVFICIVAAVPVTIFLCFKSNTLTKNYKDQFTLWEYLISKNPNMWAAYINLGKLYEGRNDFDKTISLYKKAIELNPDDFVTYYNLGTIYMRIGMNERAIILFKKVIADNHHFPDLYNNLGLAYGNTGEREKALKQFGIAMELDPNYKKAFINLITLIKERGGISAEAPQEEIDYISEEGRFLNKLGEIQGRARNIDEAVILFNEALARDPGNAIICNNLAYAYFQKGDNVRAEEYLIKAVEIDPDYEQAKMNLDFIRSKRAPSPETMEVRKGDAPDAVEKREVKKRELPAEVAEKVKDVSNKARLLNSRGVEKGKAGELDEAISLFSKAVELDPGYAEAYNNLGYTYYLKGEHKLAGQYFKKALEVDPYHEKARTNLDFLYKSGHIDRSDKETQ